MKNVKKKLHEELLRNEMKNINQIFESLFKIKNKLKLNLNIVEHKTLNIITKFYNNYI